MIVEKSEKDENGRPEGFPVANRVSNGGSRPMVAPTNQRVIVGGIESGVGGTSRYTVQTSLGVSHPSGAFRANPQTPLPLPRKNPRGRAAAGRSPEKSPETSGGRRGIKGVDRGAGNPLENKILPRSLCLPLWGKGDRAGVSRKRETSFWGFARCGG